MTPYFQHFQPILAYLLGSIPFGLIFSNLFGKGNLKEMGSRSIGATNVLRTQGKFLGMLTFVMDFLKGFIACHFLHTNQEILNLLIIAAPVLGHIFPIWLKFKGGKGVATYLGVLCALNVWTFLIALALWLTTFFITKISSISGLVSLLLSLFVFSYVKHLSHLDFINQLYVLIGLVVLIVAKHHENIKRLVNNEELHT